MNPRFAHLLTRLYPRHWRERYGAEFEGLLQSRPGDLSTSLNVVRSALRERIRPAPPLHSKLNRDQRPPSQFQVYCLRAPWAFFGLAPLVLLAGAYFLACFYLWSGWKIFLPGADTPFGVHLGPIYGLRNVYFQVGKLYYYGAPVLVGWGVCLTAVRQRVKAVWPIIGLVLIAWMGSTARIHAGRTAVPGGFGHIRMNFSPGRSVQGVYEVLFHALLILSLSLLPYLILRFQKRPRLSA